MTAAVMTAGPAQLCVWCVLVCSSFLSLLCAAFGIIVSKHNLCPRARGKRRHWITPFDLLVSLAFVLAVSGLSLMAHRLPAFLAFP